MHSVAVYLVQRLYGGPEEGGWYYDSGELCTGPALTASGVTFSEGHDDRARTMALEVQAHLDRDWNVGDHAREISSSSPLVASRPASTMAGPSRLSSRASPLRMTRSAWVSHFANLQESGPMKTFTVPFRIPCPLPCGNHGRGGKCRQRLPLRDRCVAYDRRVEEPRYGASHLCQRDRRRCERRSLAPCPEWRRCLRPARPGPVL
jgi:hypothetical protein